MGLQVQGNDGNGNTLPKSAMISIYGATGGAGAPGITENCGNPSGEGQECALHDTYNWVPGHTYRFNLSLQTPNDGNNNEVWSVKFSDITTNSTVQLGTLDVPVSWQYLGHAIITFHERFSGPTATCSGIRPSFVVFSNAVANGSIAGTTDNTFHSFNNTSCPGYVDNYYSNNVIYSGYGPNISAYAPKPTATSGGSTTKTSPPKTINKTPTVPITAPATSTSPQAQPSTTASQTAQQNKTKPLPVLNASKAAAHNNINWLYLSGGIALLLAAGIGLLQVRFVKGLGRHDLTNL